MSSGGSVALGGAEAGLLPARIRRLSNAEYEATAKAVVGTNASGISADFVPDSRQGGYTVNEAQRVDPVFVRQLAEAASKLAADIRAHVTERAPCANPSAEADKCADSFIRSFGASAYRRPLAEDEVAQLLTVFHTALEGGSYEEGVELVARGMLQSAAFLYLTEIGDAPGATVKLTPYELASSLSYLLEGRPPTEDLLGRAVRGELDTPEGRASLFAAGALSDPNKERVVRIVREWLGTDRIAVTAKDSNVYPKYADVKKDLELETETFVKSIVSAPDGGSITQLLSASSAPTAKLLEVYGNGERRGILNQGAFLSVFSHAQETAPVLRGVAVIRRVTCGVLLDPASLEMAIVPPVPDRTKTTRERFEVHSAPGCSGCHDRIDSFGFAFEGFDGMGAPRTLDNDRPVNSKVVIAGTDFDGSYADSNALVSAMAKSQSVRDCFAKQIFHALSASSAPELAASEAEFVAYRNSLAVNPADPSIADTIGAFVRSPSFNLRRAQ
jgi:hypothetical protein